MEVSAHRNRSARVCLHQGETLTIMLHCIFQPLRAAEFLHPVYGQNYRHLGITLIYVQTKLYSLVYTQTQIDARH